LFLYNFFLFFYHLAIRLASLWNPKANAWVRGRENWEEKIKAVLPFSKKPIWIHCASLGEFEQGRPLIEKIKNAHPDIPIVLSFYSPSGFEIRNYLFELDKQNIPRYLIAGSFRKKQIFFRWYGGLFRKALESYKSIFVQNESDKLLLNQINTNHTLVAGDPRIDRVIEIAKNPKVPTIASFAQRAPLLILGSSWPPEEKILFSFLEKNPGLPYSIVIAPHDISTAHLNEIEEKAPLPIQRLSEAKNSGLNPTTRILLVDIESC